MGPYKQRGLLHANYIEDIFSMALEILRCSKYSGLDNALYLSYIENHNMNNLSQLSIVLSYKLITIKPALWLQKHITSSVLHFTLSTLLLLSSVKYSDFIWFLLKNCHLQISKYQLAFQIFHSHLIPPLVFKSHLTLGDCQLTKICSCTEQSISWTYNCNLFVCGPFPHR